MPVLCCVPNCSNRGGFKFPTDKKLHFAWRVAIKRIDRNKKLWKPTNFSRVCEKHFLPDDFKPIEILSIGAKRRRCLKQNVIPSLFEHSLKVTKSAQKRRERKLEREKKSKSISENNESSTFGEDRTEPNYIFSDEIGVQELEIQSESPLSVETG